MSYFIFKIKPAVIKCAALHLNLKYKATLLLKDYFQMVTSTITVQKFFYYLYLPNFSPIRTNFNFKSKYVAFFRI